MRIPGPVLRFGSRWLLFAAGVAGWQWVAARAGDPYFPPPRVIAQRARALWFSGGPGGGWGPTGLVSGDVLPSLGRVAAGWSIAAVAGIAVGLALGRSPAAAAYCRGLLAFARAVPPPTLVPVFLVVFHIGPRMELATIVSGTVWPVLLNTADGARSVDPLTMDAVRVFRIGPLRRVTGVIVPAALPKIFAGLRVSLAIAFILMVISELVASTDGIGHQLLFAQGTSDLPAMWAWIVLVSGLGYASSAALTVVEHLALRGRRAAAGTGPAGGSTAGRGRVGGRVSRVPGSARGPARAAAPGRAPPARR